MANLLSAPFSMITLFKDVWVFVSMTTYIYLYIYILYMMPVHTVTVDQRPLVHTDHSSNLAIRRH